MADVPLPDVPCVRCRLDYQDLTSNESGNRFYLSYSGSAPTAANCVTLAGDIASAWNTWFGGLTSQNFALVEVDVLDIASDSGLSGQWAGTYNGGQTGTPLTLQSAINVEFLIARRYRGGKPRIYLPPTDTSGLADAAHWDTTVITATNANATGFFGALHALSIGAMGTLQHVNLSYYKGYNNVEIPGSRAYAAPKYRLAALHDDVTGYATKAVVGSQRRRMRSTTY